MALPFAPFGGERTPETQTNTSLPERNYHANMPQTSTKSRTTAHLAVNDEMGSSITNAIENLSSDATMFTRWRLRGARSREAIKLAETALVESMAAKRRAFIYQVGLVEDHAKKVMLSESMKNTEVIEREIARTITDAVSNFEKLIIGQEEAAYRAEIELIGNAHDMHAAGRMSARRCEQLVTSIEASTDKVVETVHRTTREILANLESRFNAALRQS